jgi:transposase
MTPEALFHQLLGLGEEWRVSRCEFDPAGGEMRLWVEEQPAFWTHERARQQQTVRPYDHTGELEWRHLSVFEHRCVLRCRLPRAQRDDGGVYRVHPPWQGLCKHFTKAFEAMALLLLREMPVAATARRLGEHDTRLWRLLHAHVAAAYPQLDFSAVTCVGCDEMSARKGRRYVSVFCDLLGRRVLFACAGRDAGAWEKFVQTLARHNGHPRAIRQVSIDMCPAYLKGIEQNIGAQAQVIFDKFHVIAKVNEAVDEARREEQKLCNAPQRALLKGARWVLLKNENNLSAKQKQRHQGLLKSTLGTLKAYQMRIALQKIYQLACPARARRKLLAWCRWVRWNAGRYHPPILADMVRCAGMVERHLEGILAHWQGRITNAFMEGLNSVFSAVKRKARGFRSLQNLIAMLYFHSANLPFPISLLRASHSK